MEVVKWAAIAAFVLFAFMLLPAHEYFSDTRSEKQRDVAVSKVSTSIPGNPLEKPTLLPHGEFPVVKTPEYSPGPSKSDPPIDDILDGDKAQSSDGSQAGAGRGPGYMEERHKPRPWWKGTEEDNYVAKSSLVPCTCTTHSMGCQKHNGGREQSWAPGDMDGGPDQYGVMKPFSSAFTNQEEPSGFLNAFNAFLH
jgi:hypothetical protein